MAACNKARAACCMAATASAPCSTAGMAGAGSSPLPAGPRFCRPCTTAGGMFVDRETGAAKSVRHEMVSLQGSRVFSSVSYTRSELRVEVP